MTLTDAITIFFPKLHGSPTRELRDEACDVAKKKQASMGIAGAPKDNYLQNIE